METVMAMYIRNNIAKGEDEFKYPTVPLEQPAGPLWQCTGGTAKVANKSH